jgi:hypothetical protein
MAGYYPVWRFSRTTLAILLATVCSAQLAFGQYTFVQDTDGAGDWIDPLNWDTDNNPGTPNLSFPNAIGATALIKQPIKTGVGGYTLTMPATDVTVGTFTIDNSADSYATKITMANNGGGRLVFEDPSGTAKYIETVNGTAGDASASVQNSIQMPILVKNTLEITQNNYPNLNTGTIFTNRIDGDINSKIIKKGLGGIQFQLNSAPGAGFGFFGQIFIQEGSIRTINKTFSISSASGITVSPGGQLELADNATPVPDYNLGVDGLGNPAVLNLSGTGSNSGNGNAEGALRFDIDAKAADLPQPRTVTFHNPVVLQGDTDISANGAGNTGALEKPITGPFGLTKSGAGKLVIMDPLSGWGGDTHIKSAGTGGNSVLGLKNPILADAKDLYMSATRTGIDLNFAGTDSIRSFFIDNVAQPTGIWGAMGSGAANESALITGTGLLNVTTAPSMGVPGDFNGNGVVDMADYVLWRKGGPLQNEVSDQGVVSAQDYTDWRARFGNTSGSGALSVGASVPEPSSVALLMLVAQLLMGIKLGRARS